MFRIVAWPGGMWVAALMACASGQLGVEEAEAQLLSGNPSYYVWAPAGAVVNSVVTADAVGMDFQTRGTVGAYFSAVNDQPVDARSLTALTLRYSTDVPASWINFAIEDRSGKWHEERVQEVVVGASTVTIPLANLAIDASGLTRYHVWLSAQDYDGTIHPLNGQFRFLLHAAGEDELGSIEVHAGDEPGFLATLRTPSNGGPKVFRIHPDAVLNAGLNIIGRHGDELHFLAGSAVTAQVQSPDAWSDNRGVVNIVDSSNLTITGLRARNTFQYHVTNAVGDNESSTALNISRSHNVSIAAARLEGAGKGVLWIHGDSAVSVNDTTIDAYYFCVGVGASAVSFSNLTAHQFNPLFTGDKHSVLWVSSSMRSSTNTVYKHTAVVLDNATLNLRSGRAIVSGNGAYDAHSLVSFRGTTAVNATNYALNKALGWVNFHGNYHGFTVQVAGNYPRPTRDLAQPTQDGEFGRFIVNTYQGGGRPSRLAPSSFCEGNDCVTSDEVLGNDQPIDLVRGGLSDRWTANRPTELSADAEGNLRIKYKAAYEAVIVNGSISRINMRDATRLRIRARTEQSGQYKIRVAFVDQQNRLIAPIVLSFTSHTVWQTFTLPLSDQVRATADKIIVGSYGNKQDVTLLVNELTILGN